MTLNQAVQRYLAVTGSFGQLMPLGSFGLPHSQLREMISGWEQDYHLSRHYELVPSSDRDSADSYAIDGIEYSAIIIRETIREVLGPG